MHTHCCSGHELKQDRELEAGADAGTLEKWCLLACSLWLVQPAFVKNTRPPVKTWSISFTSPSLSLCHPVLSPVYGPSFSFDTFHALYRYFSLCKPLFHYSSDTNLCLYISLLFSRTPVSTDKCPNQILLLKPKISKFSLQETSGRFKHSYNLTV